MSFIVWRCYNNSLVIAMISCWYYDFLAACCFSCRLLVACLNMGINNWYGMVQPLFPKTKNWPSRGVSTSNLPYYRNEQNDRSFRAASAAHMYLSWHRLSRAENIAKMYQPSTTCIFWYINIIIIFAILLCHFRFLTKKMIAIIW